jgi:foldase protein PrsA
MATKKTATKSAPARKPAAKRTASRSAAKPKAAAQQSTVEKSVETPKTTTTTTSSSTPSKGFKIKKSYIILAVTVVAVAILLYIFRSIFVAAVVNGQPISRLSVVKEAEKQSGKQVLTTLVRNTLIEQEARKQNITVSEKEIDDEIKKLEGNLQKQGQKLDQVLTMQGMSKEDLRKLIRLDKMVGKMVGKDITISDKEVNDYIAKNKESLPTGQNENELKASVKEQLKQQQLNEKVRVWLENLQKNAKINPFVDYYSTAPSTPAMGN